MNCVYWLVGLSLLLATPAPAQANDGPPARMSDEERQQIFTQAEQAAQQGPRDITLADQAVLHLPASRAFVPVPLAHRVLQALGNPSRDERLQGLIFPKGDEGWLMTVRFDAAGYVKDDDARDWNADELLESYRQGTAEANTERARMGVPALEIVGWAARPSYDAATHRLVWAMSSRSQGAPADAGLGVNYNTYALGREGYFSMNLVTELDALPRHQGAAAQLLAALEFKPGKRYADFNAATDHVAEYGLAALVAGVAAKKLGLLAVALGFVAKFAKVILLALAGGGTLLTRLWRRKPVAATPPAQPAAQPATQPTPPAGSTAGSTVSLPDQAP
jgi:uncharacterized membrane-anchored protein